MRKNDLQGARASLGLTVYYGDIDSYKTAFTALHEEIRSWRRIAEPYDLYPNMARMIANGYDPGNKIREKLRLPMKDKFEVCPRCENPMKKDHRCSGGDHKKRNRLSINLEDPFSAGKSIMNHMDSEMVNDLIVVLMDLMIDRPREG